MNERWRDFLSTQRAIFAGGTVHDFGDPLAESHAAHDGNVLVDLSHLALLRVGGADRQTFLNGQLTNDVSQVETAHSQLSAWCSPKGRMLAVFRVFRHDADLLLQFPDALRDDVVKRLRLYVLRSKVTLDEANEEMARFGFVGPDADSLLRAKLSAVPTHANDVAVIDGVICLRLPGIHPRFEILAQYQQAARLWTELKPGAAPAGASAWTWHDIMAGIPIVLPPTRDMFVPQMANLDLLDGISFNKGCYTGQEIVARLRYRGRLKQRMYRAHVGTDTEPAPGDPIYIPDAPEQPTGRVVVAAAARDAGYDLLAVIHCDSVAKADLRLGRADGSRLTIEPLPYSVPA